jgi:hypothetical protein
LELGQFIVGRGLVGWRLGPELITGGEHPGLPGAGFRLDHRGGCDLVGVEAMRCGQTQRRRHTDTAQAAQSSTP